MFILKFQVVLFLKGAGVEFFAVAKGIFPGGLQKRHAFFIRQCIDIVCLAFVFVYFKELSGFGVLVADNAECVVINEKGFKDYV